MQCWKIFAKNIENIFYGEYTLASVSEPSVSVSEWFLIYWFLKCGKFESIHSYKLYSYIKKLYNLRFSDDCRGNSS